MILRNKILSLTWHTCFIGILCWEHFLYPSENHFMVVMVWVSTLLFLGISILFFWHAYIRQTLPPKIFCMRLPVTAKTQTMAAVFSPEVILQQLKSHPLFGQFNIHSNDEIITFKTKPSFWSWGELIQIILQNNHSNQKTYRISSRPLCQTSHLDFGINTRNIRAVMNMLTECNSKATSKISH